ncbi:MAG: SRPBCC family protein [Chthoniobacterales bacterium]
MNKSLFLIAILNLLIPHLGICGDILNELSQADRKLLADGQVIIKSRDIPKAPWPELSLYQVVNAPPRVVWDLLIDYDSAATYTPNLISAEVIGTESDGSKDVRYTVKVPVLRKISYDVRNTYIKKSSSYEVKWKLLKSPLAKSSDGSLRIEPYGENQTLMCYTNLCVPITNLVASLKNQALEEAKNTVKAIKAEAERRAGS